MSDKAEGPDDVGVGSSDETSSGIDPSITRFGYIARKAKAVKAWKEFLDHQDQKDRSAKFSLSPGVIGTIIVLTSVILSFSLAKTVWDIFFLTILLCGLGVNSLHMKLRADMLRERMSRYAKFVREHPSHAPFIDPLKD
jgi:uncharacterized membrane protein